MCDGLYYIVTATSQGGQGAILRLHEWTGDANNPFVLVDQNWEPTPDPEPEPRCGRGVGYARLDRKRSCFLG